MEYHPGQEWSPSGVRNRSPKTQSLRTMGNKIAITIKEKMTPQLMSKPAGVKHEGI